MTTGSTLGKFQVGRFQGGRASRVRLMLSRRSKLPIVCIYYAGTSKSCNCDAQSSEMGQIIDTSALLRSRRLFHLQ